MGLLCINGPLKYAPSVKLCPLKDILLDCFYKFPKKTNSTYVEKSCFKNNYPITLRHKMVGVISYSRVYCDYVRAFYEYL